MTKINRDALSAEAEFDILVAEEDLILEAQMLIQRALNERGMTQAKLAELLGVRPSHVSQMLGLSPRNLTLRTIARIMHALGEKIEIRFRPAEEGLPDAEAAALNETEIPQTRHALIFDRDVWGHADELPDRNPGRRSKDAEAYAAYEPPYLMAA